MFGVQLLFCSFVFAKIPRNMSKSKYLTGQRIFPVDEGENFMSTKFLCKFALL